MEVEMVVIACDQCGTTFVITKALNERFRESHQRFYCPYGHSMSYAQKTSADIWKEEAFSRQDTISKLQAENRKLQRAVKASSKTVAVQSKKNVKSERRHVAIGG